jgi:hypothetical protein
VGGPSRRVQRGQLGLWVTPQTTATAIEMPTRILALAAGRQGPIAWESLGVIEGGGPGIDLAKVDVSRRPEPQLAGSQYSSTPADVIFSNRGKHLQTCFIMRLFLFAPRFTTIKLTIFELHGHPAGR